MARPKLPIQETVRYEVFSEYCRHADASDTLPNPHTFYWQVFKPLGYDMAWETFRQHWRQLQLDGLIHIDAKTGAVKIVRGRVITPLTDEF